MSSLSNEKPFQVGNSRRIAEFPHCQESRDLGHTAKIIGQFDIAFRSRLHEDHAGHENLIRNTRLHLRRDRLPAPDRCDLVLTEPDRLQKVAIQFRIRLGPSAHRGANSQDEHSDSHHISTHYNPPLVCLGHPDVRQPKKRAQFFSNANTRFQSLFMLTTVQPRLGASSRPRSSFPTDDLRS